MTMTDPVKTKSSITNIHAHENSKQKNRAVQNNKGIQYILIKKDVQEDNIWKKYKAQVSNHLLLRYNAHIILKYTNPYSHKMVHLSQLSNSKIILTPQKETPGAFLMAKS